MVLYFAMFSAKIKERLEMVTKMEKILTKKIAFSNDNIKL
jgi:hypothetical protein